MFHQRQRLYSRLILLRSWSAVSPDAAPTAGGVDGGVHATRANTDKYARTGPFIVTSL